MNRNYIYAIKALFLFVGMLSSFLCTAFSQVALKETSAFLSGHVYAFDGKPLAHARIDVFPLQAATSGSIPWAISDDKGAYRLRSPAFGKTRICASLENSGYPDTRDKVFASGHEIFPEVLLTDGTELENIDIHLGPPNGSVEGTIVDKDSQDAIRFASITLRWADEPSVMYSSSLPQTGAFEFALPKRHITIRIAAPGHRPWNFLDPTTHEPFIEVNPGEHKHLQIELEKVSSDDSHK